MTQVGLKQIPVEFTVDPLAADRQIRRLPLDLAIQREQKPQVHQEIALSR